MRSPRRFAAVLVGLALAGVFAAAVLASFGIRQLREDYTRQWNERLAGEAAFRAWAIQRWIAERTSDAETLASYPGIQRLVAGRDAIAPHLVEVLARTKEHHGFVAVRILASDGSPLDGEAEDGALAAVARRSASTLENAVQITSVGTAPRILFAHPIRASPAQGTDPIAGSVVLEADPEKWLYPFLLDHPTPSRTAEVLLAEREGESIVFLSPLRFRSAASPPIELREYPPKLAAAVGPEGSAETSELLDYRGVPVLAATRRIEEAGWVLVVKVDRDEALTDFRRARNDRLLALIGALLGLAALAWATTRQLRSRMARRVDDAEERFRELLEQANDAILLLDGDDGRILHANRRAEELYGWSLEALATMTESDLRPEELRDDSGSDLQRISARGRDIHETEHRAADGTSIPVEVSARNLEIDDLPVVLSIVRDIRERKLAEAHVRRLQRFLRTKVEVSRILVRGGDPDRIFADLCRIAVEHGGFAGAWVGIPDSEAGTLRIVAASEEIDRFLTGVEIRWDDSPEGSGPTGAAIREQKPVAFRLSELEPRFEGWREHAESRGFAASVALPLLQGDRVAAVLKLYAREADAFDEEILGLAHEMAGDIAFVVEILEERSELARFQHLLADAQNIAHLGSFEYLREEDRLVLSDEACRILDLDPGSTLELEGLLERLHPEDRAGFTLEGKASPGTTRSLECRFMRPQGNVRTVELRTVIEGPEEPRLDRDADQAGPRIKGTFLDITDRVRTDSRLRALFEMPPIGLLFGDVHGRVQAANDEYLRIVGLSRAELERGEIHRDEITPPEWRSLDEERTAEARLRGVCTTYRKEYARPDGTRVPVLVGYALLGEGRDETVAYILDVSDQVAREEEIRKLAAELEDRVRHRTAQLEEAVESLEAFSYSVSHDLQAPLRAIDGFAQILEEHCDTRLDQEARRIVGVIRQSVDRMSRLITDLLSFARSTGAVIHRSACDMGELARDAVRETTADEEIEVRLGELPPIDGDPHLLSQVWHNLLSNAVKFTRPRGRRTIEIGAVVETERTVYRVCDNGIGFDPGQALQIFGVFQRLHSPDRFQGSGIGLALVKRIVERHGGTVWAEGKLDEGATFFFSLPGPRIRSPIGQDLLGSDC